MDWDVFATLTTVSIIAIVSPGPDFLIVSRTSLFHSKEAALWAICGMAIGSLIHMSYIFWGLGHLPHESLLFRILHVCGAGYLFWLGCCSLFEAYKGKKLLTEGKVQPKKFSHGDAFRIGFITNLTNIQSIFFMISFFALLIPGNMPFGQQLFLYGWRLFLGVSWFVCVAFFFSHSKIRNTFLKYTRLIQAVTGGFLCTLGLSLLFSTK